MLLLHCCALFHVASALLHIASALLHVAYALFHALLHIASPLLHVASALCYLIGALLSVDSVLHFASALFADEVGKNILKSAFVSEKSSEKSLIFVLCRVTSE